MTKAESQMRRKLLRLLRQAGCHAYAVENPLACPGTPDVFAALDDRRAEVELKVAEHAGKPRNRWQVKMRATQRVWHTLHAAAGNSSWVLVQCGDYWYQFSGVWAAQHLGRCSWQTGYENAHHVYIPREQRDPELVAERLLV
jgi:hypothetical protein